MKRNLIHISIISVITMVMLTSVVFVSLRSINVSSMMTRLIAPIHDTIPRVFIEPIYDNIWGTIYHAETKQCDDTPTITGDGSKINRYNASEHRWIAISQEMLDSEWRTRLLKDTTSILYRGRIEYGDTVWVSSPHETINGWWIVHDTKNKRYRNSIDFLQTKGDGTLYDNDPMWNGKFNDIRIFSYRDVIRLNNATT